MSDKESNKIEFPCEHCEPLMRDHNIYVNTTIDMLGFEMAEKIGAEYLRRLSEAPQVARRAELFVVRPKVEGE